jgi:hypothetical protein
MSTNLLRTLVIGTVMTVGLAAAPAARACPNCKDAIAAQDGGDLEGTPEENFSNVGAAYSYSVMFMLTMPGLVLGGLSLACYRVIHAARPAAPPEAAGGDCLVPSHP